MHSKAKTQSHLKNFVANVERQFETKVKVIRSGNGSEFIMRQFYDDTGIVHQTTCIETPQKNGIVEKKTSTFAQCDSIFVISIKSSNCLLVICIDSLYYSYQLHALSLS